MMNIFVVYFLHVSCSRLIQPVEVYIYWYMMSSKKIWSAENISFLNDASFFEWSVHHPFFGRSGHHLSVWPSSVIQRKHSMWNLFMFSARAVVRMLVLMIVCAIVWVVRNSMHDFMHDLFGRSRVQTPDLAARSFWWVIGSIPWPCSLF